MTGNLDPQNPFSLGDFLSFPNQDQTYYRVQAIQDGQIILREFYPRSARQGVVFSVQQLVLMKAYKTIPLVTCQDCGGSGWKYAQPTLGSGRVMRSMNCRCCGGTGKVDISNGY